MALFKILKGPEKKDALGNSVMLSGTNGAPPLHEGWAYVTDEGNLYVDLSNTKRVKINQNADFAIKAMYDALGQEIADTYIKNITYNKSASTPTYTIVWGNNDDAILTIPVANTTDAGIITAGAATDRQVFSGTKRFAHSVIVDQTILQAARARASNASNLFKITLPAKFKNEMLVFDVVHRSYGKVARWTIEAYLYGSSNRWHMPSVAIVTNYDAAYTTKIKFGYDSNNNPIIFFPCFGTYSQVYVENVHCGLADLEADYYKGWKIEFCSTTSGTIQTEVAPKLFASYDEKNQSISSTYVKGMTLVNSATQPSYTLTKGDNTVISVNTPVASATTAGNITTGSQTLTGSKTLDTKGSLTIQKSNGFTYTGIESGSGNSYRPVWFARGDKNGTPVYNTNFTYNPSTATLKVAHLDGLAAKATADGNGDNIRTTYVKSLGLTTNKYGITYQKGDGTETTIKPNLAASGSNGGSALSAEQLNGTVAGGTLPVTHQANGSIKYFYNVNGNVTGNMPASNNANSIIQINKHPGNYDSQLGFSSNGNIYYRNFNGSAINNTTAWKQLAYTDGTIANATKALQDSQGQQINTTYLKNWSITDHATQPYAVLTKGDGTTSTVNFPIANASKAGLITNAAQTIKGYKTFSDTLQNKQAFYNVATIDGTDTFDEFIIKTKLPFANGNEMPHIHIRGYAYGNNTTVDLNVVFYIYNGAFCNYSYTTTGGWSPSKVYLSTYTNNGSTYVVLSFTGSIYFPKFTVDLLDIWSGTTRSDYGQGWTVTLNKSASGTAIPQSNIKEIGRAKLATSISGNANTATKATQDASGQVITATYIKNITLTGHATQPYLVLTKGDNTTSNLNLPIASTAAAGLITNAAQTIGGTKTFANGISFPSIGTWPAVAGETYPIKSQKINWSGSSDYAQIYYEVQGADNGMLIFEFGDGLTEGAEFRSASATNGKKVTIINGMVTGDLTGLASNAEKDKSGQVITTTYLKNMSLVNHATLPKYTITKGDGNTFNVNLPVANESNAGVITNTTQALAGNKSLKGSLSTTENITTAKQLISNIATGTSPLKVTSTTVVTNLNADTVDGMHASNNSFTQANASNTTLPTQLAIWNSLNSLLISAQALVYRGTLTPAQFKALSASGINRGDVFVVSAEGSFGGKYCEPGDMLICYDKTSSAVTWDIVQTNIDGSVVIKGGGAAATVHADVHAIARFDSNTGRVIDNSKVFIDDNGHVTAKVKETQDIGTSNNKWRTIYAKSFNGLATNATADSSGQNIMDTYIKDWTLTKHATQPFVTLTKGNGNTSDINLPIAGPNDAGLITNAAQTIYGVKTFNNSIIAKSDHDFISHGNEFNVIPKLSANMVFHFNYRQKDGNGTGKITQYNFCDGANGVLASITKGQFSGNAATATKAIQDSTGQQINTTYIKSVRLVSGTNPSYEFTRGDNTTFSVKVPISDLDGHYVKKTGDTMTGALQTPNLYVINDSSNTGYDALAYFRNYSASDWTMIIDKNNAYDWGLDIRCSGTYALRTAGSARFLNSIAVGGDVAPSYTVDVRGNMRSTGRIYANEWIQFDNWTGLYSPQNGAHFYPNNTTSYGAWQLRGTRGGYSGIHFGDSTGYMTVMDSLTHKGLYEQDWDWILYFNRDSKCLGLRTSSLTGYAVTCEGDFYCRNGWLRTDGARGWYNESYGGGWYMNDTTWIRSYASKSLYMGTGIMRTDAVCGGMWITGTHDGAIQVREATGASAGQYFQSWFSGKTPSGAWGIGPLSGSNDMYFCFGTDADYNASNNAVSNIRFGSNGTVWGAVWNDYAEFRKSESLDPGRVVIEDASGEMKLATERLQPGANIISDTYGFTIGETKENKTPIAVAGRVLAYTYENRYSYPLGSAVCSGPNGTVSLMTREEIREYPERIIGTVSEIPEYEEWGTGKVKVNGRIWIKVR